MGRKSTLRRLPPEIQAEINRILSEGRLTLDELLEHLRGIGVEGVSRSALAEAEDRQGCGKTPAEPGDHVRACEGTR